MTSLRTVLKRPGLAGRLLIWFVVLTTGPLLAVVLVTSTLSQRAIREEVVNGLAAQTRAKATQIESYVAERKRNVTTLAKMPDIVRAAEDFNRVFEKGLDSKEY